MYDQIIFGLTAVASFVTAVILVWLFAKTREIPKLLWSLSFLVLGLSTALISIDGLSVLSQPLVAPVDSLIPGFLGAGLLMYFRKNWGFLFLIYVIPVFCVLFALSFVFGSLAAPYVMLVHFPGGLIIFILPIYMAVTKKLSITSLLVGVGGLLIGIGGLALASISMNVPILPASLVLEILAPLFLSMTLLFAVGLLATPGWGLKSKWN
ncbi:MAG: hypothetical protein ABSE82_07985 [Nitrososphaerales archaeon]|jgi:hypothetical protein